LFSTTRARERKRGRERERESVRALLLLLLLLLPGKCAPLCAPACVCSKKARGKRTEVTISFRLRFFRFLMKRRVRLFSAPHAASKKAGSRRKSSDPNARNEKKILTKQKFVAEPDIENKGTQNSLFFVNAQRETSFQRDDSVDWFAFNSRGWISEGRFSSFSQCA
jgi:hypothetical protein